MGSPFNMAKNTCPSTLGCDAAAALVLLGFWLTVGDSSAFLTVAVASSSASSTEVGSRAVRLSPCCMMQFSRKSSTPAA